MRKTDDGSYVEPCPFCGEETTLFDGVRRYWQEGYPFVHECEVPRARLILTGPAPAAGRPGKSRPVQAGIQAVRRLLGGADL